MMNVQLLLLLALVGPFCAFPQTTPSTGTAPDITGDVTRAATAASGLDLTVVTGAPATDPATAPAVVTSEAPAEAATPSMKVNTEEPVLGSHAPASTEAPIALNTDHPSVESAAPTAEHRAQTTEVQPKVTTAAETETGEDVLIEAGGLSSGQIVGIVIGALLAVVIVIAAVIAAVRRMGKYSSAKNKKTAKKDSSVVSPLRKKMAKQQERPKFWKF